jgi:broad specificity phosphatase PhoE
VSRNGPPLIFIRHGETNWNQQGLIQGSIDTDLNPRGHEQARAVSHLLLRSGKPLSTFDFHVSPQKRARQTMAHVIVAIGYKSEHVVMDHRLRELGFGVWESKPFWELKASKIYPAHPEERFSWRPEGGESYEDGITRVLDWYDSLIRPTIVVSHGAVGRCLIGALTGLSQRDIVELQTPQGAYCELVDGKATWIEADASNPNGPGQV